MRNAHPSSGGISVDVANAKVPFSAKNLPVFLPSFRPTGAYGGNGAGELNSPSRRRNHPRRNHPRRSSFSPP
ncbi:hypothetical protein NG799_25725 [Laspinema sp. D1]|uniref:Uncharacterized protein n=1 Tax=Laspinema palackyanum D2a TaxID=2953684 RepID=A0ABT2MY86_9CYAN|nr:hypothetical protein [Laspinema sp. D2a]